MSIGKKNTYTCGRCSGQIVTIDKDEGVTPFQIMCRATSRCPGWMVSSFYEVDQALAPNWQWVKRGKREEPMHLKKIERKP